jgi:multidrug efflux pump
MTSFAFILGCVPLAIATGPGANSLRAIGTGVIGGMLFSTLIAIFFIPLFFWVLESMSGRVARKKQPASHGQIVPGAPASAPHAKREGE